MSGLQPIPRLLLVVEREVFPHDTPTLPNVADAAVTGKRPMRWNRAPLRVPTVPRRTQAAIENDQNGGREERPRKR